MEKYRDSIRRYGYCFFLGPFFMVIEACGEFILPYLNANMIDRGAALGDISYILQNGFYMLLTALVFISALITVLPMSMLIPQVISIYGLEPDSIEKAIPMARLCLFMCFAVWPLGFTLPNMLKAVGDVRFIMAASFASMWIFRVGSAYLMIKGFGFGVEAIWYAMYMDWIVRGLLYLWRVTSGRWKTKEVI